MQQWLRRWVTHNETVNTVRQDVTRAGLCRTDGKNCSYYLQCPLPVESWLLAPPRPDDLICLGKAPRTVRYKSCPCGLNAQPGCRTTPAEVLKGGKLDHLVPCCLSELTCYLQEFILYDFLPPVGRSVIISNCIKGAGCSGDVGDSWCGCHLAQGRERDWICSVFSRHQSVYPLSSDLALSEQEELGNDPWARKALHWW